MNVVRQRLGETLGMDVKTLPVLLMNYELGHEQKWNLVRVRIVYVRAFRRTPIAILLEDENNRGFLQKTCWNSRAQSGTILVT